MNIDTNDLTDETIPAYEVSDAALETAAGTIGAQAAAFTLASCSGLDSCPA